MNIIRLKDVLKKTGLGRSTMYQLQRIGQFPDSVSLGAKSVGWVEEEVDNWVNARIALRDSRR